MRHGASGRRSRNRGGGRNRGGNQNNRSHVFDSNGPDVRIRGTAYQIYEKYVALAKDAAGSGDRILEESYLQHAEHYQRVINSWVEQASDERRQADPEGAGYETSRANSGFQPQAQKRDEDLGLPSSILGPAREQEKATADESELQDA